MPDYREPLYLDFVAGVVISAVFIAVPMHAYLDYPSVYGDFAELKFFAICALANSAAFSLFAGPGRRVLAVVPGFVGGLGGAALHLHFLVPAASKSPGDYRYESLAVFLAGASPGILLYLLLLRRRRDSNPS